MIVCNQQQSIDDSAPLFLCQRKRWYSPTLLTIVKNYNFFDCDAYVHIENL